MNIGAGIVCDVNNFSAFANQKTNAPGHVFSGFAANAVGVGDFSLRVSELRKIQIILLNEFLVAFRRIETHADDIHASLFLPSPNS